MSRELVSIAVLNFERKDTLRRTLERAVSQRYEPLEVLVVDNGSTDGSDAMVRKEFPSVRLVRLDENVGCAARNEGVRSARGRIVVTLDNDVLLEDEGAVGRAVEAFRRYPTVACVNFKIVDPEGSVSRRDWCHPRDWRRSADETFLTDYVLEGASAFRRDVFLELGGYWPQLFIGHEGWDLALRLIDARHQILYFPEVTVVHLVSKDARSGGRIYYTFTRNAIWVAVRNHDLPRAAVSVARDLALMAFSSLRAAEIRSFFRGFVDGLRGLRGAYAARAPLRPDTYATLTSLRAGKPSWIERAKRHWKERPI